MQIHKMALSVLALSALSAAGFADQITTQTATGDVTVTTDQPATVIVAPNDSASAPVVNPESSASANPAYSQDPDAAAQNQDLAGTVQSVDRRNRSLVVQSPEGRDIGVAYNHAWHIYRRGEEIGYRDVEPNDLVVLKYRS